MGNYGITIYHPDRTYLRAAAERLSLILKGVTVELCQDFDPERDSSKEVFVLESYAPMSAAAVRISEKLGIEGYITEEKNGELIGFTSAVGGAGTTSAALALGRVFASLYGYRTIYISMDYLSSKCSARKAGNCELIYELLFNIDGAKNRSGFSRDRYGLEYMEVDGFRNPMSLLDSPELSIVLSRLSEGFDRVIIDAPLGSDCGRQALDYCDELVICGGWQEKRLPFGQELADHFKASRERVTFFPVLFDENGTEDIYGQFGAEVRGLAQQLEGA